MVIAATVCVAVSCKKEVDYSGTKAPEIQLMMDELHPDLNRVDNTPIVCVVFAEAGLEKVDLFITEGDSDRLFSSVTKFNDPKQYSMKETPTWSENISAVHIVATDKAGRGVQADMDVIVTPVLPAPVISFNYEKIVIDEKKEDPSSLETTFTVESSNTLDAVSAKLFREEGTVDIVLTPSFKAGSVSYTFTQTIDYINGDRALQVTATDHNQKLKIETLQIQYIPAPAPEFTPTGSTTLDPVFVRSSDSREFTFNIATETGLAAVQAYKVVKDAQGNNQDILLGTEYYDPASDFDVDYSFNFDSFDNASHAIKFVATDRLNHSTTVAVKTFVDMRLGENIPIASQYNAKTPLIFDGSTDEHYCFFSVKDFKTYSLFYFWDTANRRNIDFFYFAWNYGGATDLGVRLMRANEDRQGNDSERYLAYTDPEDASKNIPELGTGGDWGGRNATLIKRLPSTFTFNFENATVADLTAPQVSTLLNQGKTAEDWYQNVKAGTELLFKTGSLSTCPNCVGIMRVESVIGSRNDFGKTPVYFEISIKAQVID